MGTLPWGGQNVAMAEIERDSRGPRAGDTAMNEMPQWYGSQLSSGSRSPRGERGRHAPSGQDQRRIAGRKFRSAAKILPGMAPTEKIFRSRRIWSHARAMIASESKIAMAVTPFLSTLPRQIAPVATPVGSGD